MNKGKRWLLLAAGLIAMLGAHLAIAAEMKHGTLVTEHLASSILRENHIGLDPNRSIKVYLPPGYAGSHKSYPVVYYFHNTYWSPEKMFEDG